MYNKINKLTGNRKTRVRIPAQSKASFFSYKEKKKIIERKKVIGNNNNYKPAIHINLESPILNLIDRRLSSMASFF